MIYLLHDFRITRHIRQNCEVFMRCHHHIFRRLLSLALMICLLSGVSLAESVLAVVNQTSKAYGDSSLTGRSVSLDRFTVADVLNVSGSVAKVKVSGYTLYVDASSLQTLDRSGGKEMVFARTAKVYALPSTKSDSSTVKAGTKVNVLLTGDGIALVEKNGTAVYTALSNLKDPSEPQNEPSAPIAVKVFVRDAKVYASASTSSRSATVKAGTKVNVLAVSGNVALVEKDGVRAYAYASDLGDKVETSVETPVQSAPLTPIKDMIVSRDTRAYAAPSKSSKSVTVKAGTRVSVLQTGKGAALVEKDGVRAYMYLKDLEDVIELTSASCEVIVTASSLKVYSSPYSYGTVVATLKKDDKLTLTACNDTWARLESKGVTGYAHVSGLAKYENPASLEDQIFSSTKYSNEEKIYYYLVYVGKLSPAAACGILSNIRSESSFNPSDTNKSSGAYGICQWLGGRKTNLKNYCAEHGFASDSLQGQCQYLLYELKKSYTKVYNYITSVSNDAQGAYDAGYYWCYYYEIPENRASNSVARGNRARDVYWPKYN